MISACAEMKSLKSLKLNRSKSVVLICIDDGLRFLLSRQISVDRAMPALGLSSRFAKDFMRLSVIGKGSFGKVYRVNNIQFTTLLSPN